MKTLKKRGKTKQIAKQTGNQQGLTNLWLLAAQAGFRTSTLAFQFPL